MYKILKNEKLNENSYEMIVEAPMVVNKAMPGQFVIVMAKSDSERIPLTIYDYDKDKGLLHLIYQVVGGSTLELSKIKDELFGVVGPLGNPNEICMNINDFKDKKVVYVAGGVGVAPVYPQVKYLKEKGIKVDVIYGARSKDLFLIQDKIESVADNMYYATDDGSFGTKGFVTTVLEEHIKDYDICVAIGPVIMMKSVCDLTKKYKLKTIVSMNPIMVDGSGMCGACRCEVDGKTKFACIHGPEFDGHKINFDIALNRMNIYKEEEQVKLKEMEANYE
ncbi:MAG: sulfide/dihydroorotate dehydrogenase-like FAD/NAD-binding protein [Bacilli bacterium]|nr:sulfide/dihydroorotate dehydrogenase-like FAD/NAD-binding protein [Bacilli bacterium]MBR3049108.1 sulfide/dihydroorotate dehydrogenase-like FAD/NAD-binding protein [Bacilli bacterium]